MLSPYLLKALKETFFARLQDPWTAWLILIAGAIEYCLLGGLRDLLS